MNSTVLQKQFSPPHTSRATSTSKTLTLSSLEFPFPNSLTNRFRAAAQKLITATAVILGITNFSTPAHGADSEVITTAPNGKPWIEGDIAHFSPKVNYSLEARALQAAQFAWAVREHSRTNGLPTTPAPTNFVGTIPTARMKEIFLTWANQYRERHGLRPMIYGPPPNATFTEQGLADAALYQRQLYRSGLPITHYPERATTAPFFSSLTPAIIAASNQSSVDLVNSAAPSYAIMQPYEMVFDFIRDTPTETGHRDLFLDPGNQYVTFGAVPVNDDPELLLIKRAPIRFATDDFVGLLQVSTASMGRELTPNEKSVVFPPAGWNLAYWSRSSMPCDPDWTTISFFSTEYDLVHHRPTITITEESSGKSITASYFETHDGATSTGHQSISWQRTGPTSFSSSTPNYVSIKLTGLVLKGDASNTPRTVTWRFGYSDYTAVVLETTRSTSQSTFTFPAAHLYDGWERSTATPPPFNPWQIECSRDVTFSALVDPKEIPDSHCIITPDGMVKLSFDLYPSTPGNSQIYTRIKRKPGTPYSLHPLEGW